MVKLVPKFLIVRIPKNENFCLVKFGMRIDSICEYCGCRAGWDTFKSAESRKEFNTSGLCQKCQDEME